MPKYELTYLAACGNRLRRVLYADHDSEVAELIAQEGLAEVTVRPALRRTPAPEPPPAAAATPRPLPVRVISTPSDLRGDKSGGLLPWMTEEDKVEESKNRKLGLARSRQRHREMKLWHTGHSRVPLWKLTVEAIDEGAIELGRIYTTAEVEQITGTDISGGVDMLALRMAERSEFRVKAEGNKQVFQSSHKLISFHHKIDRAHAA